jgi:hypothetical protein
MRRPNSFAGLDNTTYGIENGVNLNFQHGRMRVVLAAVSGYYVFGAEDNILRILAVRRLRR